jgi:hypothetical protein
MMKITGKLAIVMLLAALVLWPLQTAQAKGLYEGPIFGSNFTLKSGETLNQDAVVFGGAVTIEKDATVNGAVVLFGGSLTLDGYVSQDVVIMGGAVRIGKSAHIHGSLITFGAPVQRETGSKVDGDVVSNPTRADIPSLASPSPLSSNPAFDQVFQPFWNGLGILTWSFILAMLAMLIALFMPVQMRRVADGVVAQPFISFGMGLLTLILFIVAIVALGLFSVFIITLPLTLPMIFIVATIFTAACIFGWLVLGMEAGVRIARMFNREWPLPLVAGLGIFTLNFVAQSIQAFVPCIGGFIPGLLGFVGLGAVLLTRFGTRSYALAGPSVIVQPAVPDVKI